MPSGIGPRTQEFAAFGRAWPPGWLAERWRTTRDGSTKGYDPRN